MNDNNRLTVSYIIRIAAGAYLIYLAYQLMTGMKTSGDWKWYMVLFAGLFAVTAVILVITSIKGLLMPKPQKTEEEKEAAAGENPEGTPEEISEGTTAGTAEITEETAQGTPEAIPEEAVGKSEASEEPGIPASEEAAESGSTPAAEEAPAPRTKDIRERLRLINEAEGVEADEAEPDEADTDETDGAAADLTDTEESKK